MMKTFMVMAIALSFILGSYSLEAKAQQFTCSVCGSTEHGSLWHDSDKDGTNDR